MWVARSGHCGFSGWMSQEKSNVLKVAGVDTTFDTIDVVQ
jgi:hypothetical protein